jgi:hypothetical protein
MKKKPVQVMPPDIMALKESPRFEAFSEDDMLSFYLEFRSITQGKNHLNKREFFELIKCFNVR